MGRSLLNYKTELIKITSDMYYLLTIKTLFLKAYLRLSVSDTNSIRSIKKYKTQSGRFNNHPVRTKLPDLFNEKYQFQLESKILLSYPIIKIVWLIKVSRTSVNTKRIRSVLHGDCLLTILKVGKVLEQIWFKIRFQSSIMEIELMTWIERGST